MSEKKDLSSPLDKARSDILYWATNPTSRIEALTFAHLTPGQPYALAVLRSILNFWEQNCEASFRDKDDKVIKKPHEAIIDYKLESEFGNQLVSDITAASVAVSAKRAKLVLETSKDIGRPNQSLFGSFADLLRGKDQELDQPEEVPVYE